MNHIKRLLDTRKKKIIATALLVLVIILGVVLYITVFSKDKAEQQTVEQKYYSKLTGNEVAHDVFEQPILGVMVENSEAARPQLGLDSAGIVFEAVTEGGITRYLALYQEDQPENIEPVRSLRPHFLNWLMGFDASVAHVGGSAEALKLVDQRNAKSLNQFKYTKPYTRDSKRPAPHNVIGNTSAMRDLQKQLGQTTSNFTGFLRKDSSPSETSEATTISIDFSRPIFKAEFRYNKVTNNYERYLAGKPHIDRATGKPITVVNLIVLKTKEVAGGGVQALGSGEALIFNDGKVQKAKWQQTDFNQRIKLLDEVGNEIPLLRGDSWVSAVGIDRKVTY